MKVLLTFGPRQYFVLALKKREEKTDGAREERRRNRENTEGEQSAKVSSFIKVRIQMCNK